jgi:hypothetical protein
VANRDWYELLSTLTNGKGSIGRQVWAGITAMANTYEVIDLLRGDFFH